MAIQIRSNNENLVNILKNLVRQSSQGGNNSSGLPYAGSNSGIHAKKLISMKNQNVLKGVSAGGPPLKPLYSAINKTLKYMDSQSVGSTRSIIIKASEEIEMMKQYASLPPLYGVGGTGVGGYEPLPLVEAPYLTPVKDPLTYTLVLDLDETLVHYFEVSTPLILIFFQVGSEGHFLVRPGCDTFLREMSQLYEVVIFTAAMQDVLSFRLIQLQYADWVLDQIDKDKCITYRLYRQHAFPHGPIYVKDLSRIGRDLSRTIIVDNVAENFQLQPDNGIFIKSWFDD